MSHSSALLSSKIYIWRQMMLNVHRKKVDYVISHLSRKICRLFFKKLTIQSNIFYLFREMTEDIKDRRRRTLLCPLFVHMC